MANPKLYFNDSDLLEEWENVENWFLYPNLYLTDDEPTSPEELDIWGTIATSETPSVQKIWHNGAWVTNEVFPFHPTEPPWMSATAYLDYDLDAPIGGNGNLAMINSPIGDTLGVWQVTGTCLLPGVVLNVGAYIIDCKFTGAGFNNSGNISHGVYGDGFINAITGHVEYCVIGQGATNDGDTLNCEFGDGFTNNGITYGGVFGDGFTNGASGTTNDGVFGPNANNNGASYAGVFGDYFYNGGGSILYGGIVTGANTYLNGGVYGVMGARNITFVVDGVTVVVPDIALADYTLPVISHATIAQSEILGPLL
ncbi:MAG: hypothetical protein WCS43_11885 [Verrucomicrobiota bacterium]